MKKRVNLSILLLLFAGLLSVDAQEIPVRDSLSAGSAMTPPFFFPYLPSVAPAPKLYAPAPETAVEKVSKVNLDNFHITASPILSPAATAALFVMSFFLSNPFAFPTGCVPMMNHSFPYIYAVIPGQQPYDNPYSSEHFPKCIESEYDAASGTYRQVMVDWEEYLNKTSGRYDFTVSKMPVPKVIVNPSDRFVR